MNKEQLLVNEESKGIKNVEMVWGMIKGYIEMAQINLEEANLAPHTLTEGLFVEK